MWVRFPPLLPNHAINRSMRKLNGLANSYWGMNLDMVNHPTRLVDVWKSSLNEIAKDKVVVDLGCGTGVLGMYALEQGAKFVYFVEGQDRMVALLEETLPTILPYNNYKIIHKNIFDLATEDFDLGVPDIVVSETIGAQIFEERYVSFCQHMKSLYKDLIFIPNFLEVEIRIAEIDHTKFPWPYNEPSLIEIYKNYYDKVNFFIFPGLTGLEQCDPELINLEQTKLLGSIFYDAKTDKSNLSFNFEIDENKECLIYCIGKVSQDLVRTRECTHFGWYLNPKNSKGKYQLLFDIPTNKLHISRR